MTNDERRRIEKEAEKRNYSWNSDGTKMTNGNKSLSWSSTGNSVNLNGSTYNNSGDTKKSSKW